MSYQIKSTPFFRRMVSTSKRNGQLQKLKDEYDRMKEFNEHTIDLKMRQVRLKRLFREIEEIKDAKPLYKRRRVARDKSKTVDDIRVETLVKAKELGKAFSKRNAEVLKDRSFYKSIESLSSGQISNEAVAVMRSKVNDRKARSAKRINYGNEISRTNLEHITARPRHVVLRKRESEIEMARKKEKLQQRLNYGNTRSFCNISKIAKRNAKHMIAVGKAQSGSLINLVRNVKAKTSIDIRLQPNETKLFPSQNSTDEKIEESSTPCLVLPPVQAIAPLLNQAITAAYLGVEMNMTMLNGELDEKQRAKERWRKLALTVRNRFDGTRRRQPKLPQSVLNNNVELGSDMSYEYKLRSISNDTDLPMSQINVKLDLARCDSNCDSLADEVLMHVETLDKPATPAKTFKYQPEEPEPEPETRTTIQPAPIVVQSDEKPPQLKSALKPTPQASYQDSAEIRQQVEEYVKLFEPIVREAAEKEVYEFGINKLRGVFEHENQSG